jgi:hypothetical protein
MEWWNWHPIVPDDSSGTVPHKDAREWMSRATKEIDHDKERIEELEDALIRIQQWAEAYPLDIFPEPDLKKAAEALKRMGMTLDAVAASNMRHCLSGVKGIVEAVMEEK